MQKNPNIRVAKLKSEDRTKLINWIKNNVHNDSSTGNYWKSMERHEGGSDTIQHRKSWLRETRDRLFNKNCRKPVKKEIREIECSAVVAVEVLNKEGKY